MAATATAQSVILEEQTQPIETVPPHEEIAALAHELWERRGCPIGSPEEDWIRAEQELKSGSVA